MIHQSPKQQISSWDNIQIHKYHYITSIALYVDVQCRCTFGRLVLCYLILYLEWISNNLEKLFPLVVENDFVINSYITRTSIYREIKVKYKYKKQSTKTCLQIELFSFKSLYCLTTNQNCIWYVSTINACGKLTRINQI